MSTTPDPWEFEGPDPEVGIFGDTVYHGCAANDAAEDGGNAEQTDVTRRTSGGGKTVDVITTWTCPACGATTTTTETQPRDWHEDQPLG